MFRLICILFLLIGVSVIGQDSAPTERKLFIHGGGGITDSVREQFARIAGGEDAHLVVVPTATADEYLPTKEELNETWGKFGIGDITILHTRDRLEADSKEFLLPLKDATAIWFGGGRTLASTIGRSHRHDIPRRDSSRNRLG